MSACLELDGLVRYWLDSQLACRRGMFRLTNLFVNLNESLAEWGILVRYTPTPHSPAATAAAG